MLNTIDYQIIIFLIKFTTKFEEEPYLEYFCIKRVEYTTRCNVGLLRFAKESMLVKDYSLSVPLKQNALVPQSISGSVVSAANKPNTEEPEPLMEA